MTPPFDRPSLEARLAEADADWGSADWPAECYSGDTRADLRSCLAEIDRLTTERDAASTRAEDWLDAHHVSERRLKESQAEVSRLSAEITRLREEEQASRDQVVLLGPLLLELAGFLRLQADGAVPVPAHASREAAELLDKVGTILSLTEG